MSCCSSDHSDSSSADHPDSKSICKSGVGGDNDLKQEEEKVRLELMMDELNLEEIVLKLQKSIESKRQLEHDWKQEAEIRKKEKEKVRHQEEMEALKVQEQAENQRQHEKDAKLQKHMAEIHNKTRRSWSSGHPLDRRSNSFVNMGGSSPDSKEQRQLLRDRWEAVMRVYNDPTTDESERPVMPSRNNDPDVEKEAHDEP
ncbi:hypothetical protein FRX31_017903 [Thalictrum thalictroides]|uniref:Uncharacterized protein n=1 Tax=Thalictrum thalictroides TaxID=46969 RepID=A0A7J6W7L0_THATH|nr:hypothetical protein FRX31_017903 [Thalictrum thalictroides]